MKVSTILLSPIEKNQYKVRVLLLIDLASNISSGFEEILVILFTLLLSGITKYITLWLDILGCSRLSRAGFNKL